MSTRKIIRNMLRRKAEVEGYRPSKFVHAMFERFQIEKFGGGEKGAKIRTINVAKGTHPKKNWRTRIEAVVE